MLQRINLDNCITEIWHNNENVTIGIVGTIRTLIELRKFERRRENVEDIWSED